VKNDRAEIAQLSTEMIVVANGRPMAAAEIVPRSAVAAVASADPRPHAKAETGDLDQVAHDGAAAVVDVSPHVAKSARSASITFVTSITRIWRDFADTLANAARSNHDASSEPVPGTSVR
jgi:hypothetical protein